MTAFLRLIGRTVYPATPYRNNSASARSLQLRVGLVTAVCASTGAMAISVAVLLVVNSDLQSVSTGNLDLIQIIAALALAIFSVYLPQVVFRTGNSARTREILNDPTAPPRPWRATTVTFSAVLVGAMLAGLYFQAPLTLAFFGLALMSKLIFTTRHALNTDANARFHGLAEAWTSGVIAAAAFLIVSPLAAAVEIFNSIWPLALAALVAMYLGLAFNAVERWIISEKAPWAFAQDSVDTRRILVALVSAFITWAAVLASDRAANLSGDYDGTREMAAGFGVFVAFWLLLWFSSIRVWKFEAHQNLRMWRTHQSEILARLSHGTLNAELARKAALPTTARLALEIFAATGAMTIMRSPNGITESCIASTGVFENSPPVKARDMLLQPNLHIPLNSSPNHTENSSIVISGWLWPGWFMTRSHALVNEFAALANTALFVPALASHDDPHSLAFTKLFDSTYQWPNMSAYEEALGRLQGRVDAAPQSSSLLVACYAIDDFGALAGGKFEQAALAQIHRLVQGHKDFAGHDLFVAYESPGRIWLALSSGPIIRTGITLLQDLQTRINESGSIPSHRVDLDVHVSVSFGYATHQVDAISLSELMAACRDRLEKDFSLRNSLDPSQLLPVDIRPEDFNSDPADFVTAENVLQEFKLARESDGGNFSSLLYPITSRTSDQAQALLVEVGWDHIIGQTSLLDPGTFSALINRQLELAAEGTAFYCEQLVRVMTELDIRGHFSTPVMMRMPSILLNPDAGIFALPNILGRTLDRRQASRTVVLIDSIPLGSGQAFRMLRDRGINVALTSSAAIGADPNDLTEWHRWAIVFPGRLFSDADGLDPLVVQQTSLAIATTETRLMASVDELTDQQVLGAGPIKWLIEQSSGYDSVGQVMDVETASVREV
mgnify:CR=1 FL=1